jgi:hypothetical protein
MPLVAPRRDCRRTVLKSVLTQLWCKRGTCGTLRKSMTNQLSHGNLLPDLSKVTLRRVFKTDQGWIMKAHGQNSAICPGCQRISRSRHSWYWRSLRDLPVQGTQVILRLHLGRLALPERCVRAANLHRTSLQGLRPHTHNRPSDPARSSPQ